MRNEDGVRAKVMDRGFHEEESRRRHKESKSQRQKREGTVCDGVFFSGKNTENKERRGGREMKKLRAKTQCVCVRGERAKR